MPELPIKRDESPLSLLQIEGLARDAFENVAILVELSEYVTVSSRLMSPGKAPANLSS